MDTNGKLVKIIVQGGAISLALVIMYFYYNTVTNHLDHSSEALNQNTQALIGLQSTNTELINVVRELKSYIR